MIIYNYRIFQLDGKCSRINMARAGSKLFPVVLQISSLVKNIIVKLQNFKSNTRGFTNDLATLNISSSSLLPTTMDSIQAIIRNETYVNNNHRLFELRKFLTERTIQPRYNIMDTGTWYVFR